MTSNSTDMSIDDSKSLQCNRKFQCILCVTATGATAGADVLGNLQRWCKTKIVLKEKNQKQKRGNEHPRKQLLVSKWRRLTLLFGRAIKTITAGKLG